MPGYDLINLSLYLMLLITALAISATRRLFAAAMLSGIFSLLSACIFVLQDAVDVAFTEAAVGAGMTTVLFLGALALTRSRENDTPTQRSVPALLVSLATGGLLAWAVLDLPGFADPDSPVHTHPLTERFLQTSTEEIGVPNAVTSVLASYRGYDTFGEVVVIFTAGIGVLVLLGRNRRRRDDGEAG